MPEDVRVVPAASSYYLLQVQRVRDFLENKNKPDGLYPNYLGPKTGRWGSLHVTLGAPADSFYEYLLKSYLLTGHRDLQAKRLYDAAIEVLRPWLTCNSACTMQTSLQALEKHLKTLSAGGLTYFAEFKSGRKVHRMEHLACFAGRYFI